MGFGMDGGVLAFAVAATLLAWLLSGLGAALRESRPDLAASLKGARTTGSPGGRRGRRFRALLLVTEVAVTAVLLVGASLLLRSFLALAHEPGGMSFDRLLTLWTALEGDRYGDPHVRAN